MLLTCVNLDLNKQAARMGDTCLTRKRGQTAAHVWGSKRNEHFAHFLEISTT